MSRERHERLSEALARVLELEGSEQRELIERLRVEEPDLVEEIESLLDVDRDLETEFMATPVLGDPALLADAAREDAEDPADALPRWIGPYRLEEVLGTGGMGKVYLARQREPLERTVALKLIRGGFLDPRAAARFEMERRVLAQLEHPNIGRILDAGTTDDDDPYFALEVVDGEPLNEYCDRRKLGVEERLRIMVEVCRGVEHAHRKQIVHRDLKPSNILVAEIDGRPVPKIIDFGIAEILGSPGTKPERGRRGPVVGTPTYMSPEALEGAVDVDTRADVYSLGVLLYLLLAGRRPFDGETVSDLVQRVIREEPPPPSARVATAESETAGAGETAVDIASHRGTSVPRLRRRLRGELDWIVMRATARDRGRRYGSVSDLADDIERHLERLPIQARPSGGRLSETLYPVGKWISRHRLGVALWAVAVLVASGVWIQDARARHRTERLLRAGEELTREIERTEWRLRVAHLLPLQDLTPELDAVRADMRRLEARVPELYAGDRGAGEYALGRGALSLGRLDEARRRLTEAWELGYRRPEAALALGTTLGRLYEQRLDAVERTPDADARERLRREAETELRDPALAMLERALDAPGLPEPPTARIAYYRGDLDAALAESRAAFERRPSHFEAKLLEAQVLQRMAAEAEPDAVAELLDQAEAAALEGLRTARSSPEGRLRLCRIRSRRTSQAARYATDGIDRLYERCLEACDSAIVVTPGSVAARLEQAAATLDLAEVELWDRHRDPSAILQRMEAKLAEVLAVAERPAEHRPEVERLRGTSELLSALYLEQAGEDPRPKLAAAIEHLQRAADLEPGLYFVSSDLAYLYSTRANYARLRGDDPTGDFEQADRYARQAIADAPDRMFGYTYLAQALLRRAEYRTEIGSDPSELFVEAEEAVEKAEEIDPGRIATLSTRTAVDLLRAAWILKTGGDPTATLERLIRSTVRTLEAFPDSAFAMLMRGQGHLGLARYAALHGRDPSAHWAEARRWYDEGTSRLPRLPGPYVELGSFAFTEAVYLRALGESPVASAERAVELASRAYELDPKRADALSLRGEARGLLASWRAETEGYRPGLFAPAERDVQEARSAEPHRALRSLAVARVAAWKAAALAPGPARRAELESGLEAARRAYELDPSLAEALAVEGELLRLDPATREPGRARIEQALEQNKNLSWTWRKRTGRNAPVETRAETLGRN